MNLTQLVTAIGQRTGMVGPNDLTACRNFVGIRYNQLWQAFLWKDALVEYVVTIDPVAADYVPSSPYLPTKGHLLLPSVIGNVIAVRSNQDKMNVERPMMYFRVGTDQFSKTGKPCEFYLLASCVWEFDVISRLRLGPGNNADLNQLVTVDSLGADGVSVNRAATALQALIVDLVQTDRVDNVLKAATVGAVNLLSAGYAVNLIPAGTTYDVNGVFVFNGAVPGNDYDITFGANDLNAIVFGPVQYNAPDPVTIPSPVNSAVEFNGLANQPVTATISATNYPVITLQPSDTAAQKRQRIRFVRIPDQALTIRVLGKRVTPPLSNDNDEPAVRGMDGVLYAMATYDMAHRDEFSKVGATEAQLLMTEAVGPNFLTNGVPGGFLKKLIEEEVEQSAHNSRIMPEQGFGGCQEFGYQFGTKSDPYGL